MAITSGGRDPDLKVPISATDNFSAMFTKFRVEGTTAASKVAHGMSTAGAGMKKTFSAIGSAAVGMSKIIVAAFVAIGGAIVYASSKGDQFEESLIAMGRVKKQPVDQIRASMMSLPPILGNLTDLTKGYYQVISAGVTEPKKALDALTQASKISKITQVEQGEVVKGLTKLMAGYGDQIKSVSEASDILFSIEKTGQTSVAELIPVIGGLAKNAADLKINTTDLGGAFAQVTQFAGNTEEAATQVRAVFTALLKPSEDLAAAIKKAGIESITTSLEQEGLTATLKRVRDASGGTDESFRKLFTNVRAGAGASALAADNFKGLEERITGMKEGVGSAADAWNDWEKSGSAATARLKANLEDFVIKLGEKFKLTDIKNSISDFIENNGGSLINFITNLPTIASRSLKLILDLWLKFIGDPEFRKNVLTHVNDIFNTIVLNAGEGLITIGKIIAKASSVIWVPLVTNLKSSWDLIALQIDIRIAEISQSTANIGLSISEGINEALKKIGSLKIPFTEKLLFPNMPNLDEFIRAQKVNIKNWDEFMAEQNQKIVDILAGKPMTDAADKIREQLNGIKPAWIEYKSSVTGNLDSIKKLLADFGESDEYQKFKEDIEKILNPQQETGANDYYSKAAESYQQRLIQSALMLKQQLETPPNYTNKIAADEYYYNAATAYQQRLIDAARQTNKIQKALDKERLEYNSQVAANMLSSVVNTFDTLNTLSDGKHKEQFYALKRARQAQALVNAYFASSKALADPEIPTLLSYSAAALAWTAAIAQVAAIEKTEFGSSSGGQSLGGVRTQGDVSIGNPLKSSIESERSGVSNQEIHVHVNSPMVDANWDKIAEDNIAPAIGRALKRNVSFS